MHTLLDLLAYVYLPQVSIPHAIIVPNIWIWPHVCPLPTPVGILVGGVSLSCNFQISNWRVPVRWHQSCPKAVAWGFPDSCEILKSYEAGQPWAPFPLCHPSVENIRGPTMGKARMCLCVSKFSIVAVHQLLLQVLIPPQEWRWERGVWGFENTALACLALCIRNWVSFTLNRSAAAHSRDLTLLGSIFKLEEGVSLFCAFLKKIHLMGFLNYSTNWFQSRLPHLFKLPGASSFCLKLLFTWDYTFD